MTPLKQPRMRTKTLTVQFHRGQNEPRYAILEKDGVRTILPLDRPIREKQLKALDNAGYTIDIVYDSRTALPVSELRIKKPKAKAKKAPAAVPSASVTPEQQAALADLLSNGDTLPEEVRRQILDAFPDVAPAQKMADAS